MDRKTSILLGIKDFKVIGQKIINDQEIEFEVTHRYQISICPECKNWTSKIHEQKEERRVRDCSVFGKRSYLVFKTRRFQCENKDCQKVFVERLTDIELGSLYTKRYEEWVYLLCQKNNLLQVSKVESLGYDAVEGIYYRQSEKRKDEQDKKYQTNFPKVISIDEIALKKGRKNYILIISSPDDSTIIDVLPNRKKETLINWFSNLTPSQRSNIQEVTIDMWEPYQDAVKEVLPLAEIIIDRFHVQKNLNSALDKTRKEINKTLDPEVKKNST